MEQPRARELPGGTVTLLFSDIEGSTRLLQELGDAYGDLLDEHYRLLRAVWGEHGGIEVNTEGDAFFIAFARAPDAITAAATAQRALAAHRWPHGRALRVRMGIHTGTPSVRDGDYWGVDVHYAARLCGAAHGGQVLLSSTTRALVPEANVDDLGEHAVKDFPAARSLHHLVIDGRHRSEFPPPRTLQAALTNLPSIDAPLVGRDAELAELRNRLTGSGGRLVTLVGLGGTGKTRLALASAAELLPAFADGVFVVALAPVTTSEGVPAAIAEALGASRIAELGAEAAAIEHLRRRRMLLVLDNVEHVLDAAPVIGRLLQAAPDVRILATSQAPLRLSAEHVHMLEPLALPSSALAHDADSLAGVAAVALFAERARAADGSFALTDANATAVAELCRRLEGLPLALELAAARVRMGGVEGLLRALERGPESLGRGARDLPERQRGIRAALNFTVSLLGDEERELFAGLGGFAGAWTLEQAEAIFGEDLDTWEAMAALIDFSLIRTRGDGRLTMAERVRRHARELLAQSGREEEVRRRHAELMAQTIEALAREQLLDLHGVIARTHDHLAEIELALSWSAAQDAALHRRVVAAGGRPMYFAGRLPAMSGEIERLMAADDAHDAVSGRLMIGMGMVCCLKAEMAAAADWMEAAVECHRETASIPELVNSMAILGHMLTLTGRGTDARACLAEALELAADHPDTRMRDQLEGTVAFAAVTEGRYDEAEARLQEIMARPERTDFAARAAISYWADCALGRGEYGAALDRFAEALRFYRDKDPNNSVLQLIGMAAARAGLANDGRAAELVGAVRAACAEIGMGEEIMFHADIYDAPLRAAAQRLGEERWEALQRRGRHQTLAQTTDWALSMADVGVGA